MKFFCIIVGGWEEGGETTDKAEMHLRSLSELLSSRGQKKNQDEL